MVAADETHVLELGHGHPVAGGNVYFLGLLAMIWSLILL